jgi:hypothetical protein
VDLGVLEELSRKDALGNIVGAAGELYVGVGVDDELLPI